MIYYRTSNYKRGIGINCHLNGTDITPISIWINTCSVLFGSSWTQLIVVSLVFFGAISQRILGAPCYTFSTIFFSGWCYLPGDTNGPANSLIPDFLFGKKWSPHPIHLIAAWITACTNKGFHITWVDWCIFPDVALVAGMPSDHWNSSVGPKLCQTTIFILF